MIQTWPKMNLVEYPITGAEGATVSAVDSIRAEHGEGDPRTGIANSFLATTVKGVS